MLASEFNILRELVLKESGIHLGDSKKYLLSARVMRRLRELNLQNEHQYIQFLATKAARDEIPKLIDSVTTNVTSFFREPSQFDFLKKYFQLNKEPTDIKIWSAGCSSGEEAYSVAIEAHRSGQAGRRTKILASDISASALKTAEGGVYAGEKLLDIKPELKHSYFKESKRTGHYKLDPKISRMVEFRNINLSSLPFTHLCSFEIILCRNVMIYFTPEHKEKLIREFHRLLKPGGYLLIGHSESLLRHRSLFQYVAPMIYLKK